MPALAGGGRPLTAAAQRSVQGLPQERVRWLPPARALPSPQVAGSPGRAGAGGRRGGRQGGAAEGAGAARRHDQLRIDKQLVQAAAVWLAALRLPAAQAEADHVRSVLQLGEADVWSVLFEGRLQRCRRGAGPAALLGGFAARPKGGQRVQRAAPAQRGSRRGPHTARSARCSSAPLPPSNGLNSTAPSTRVSRNARGVPGGLPAAAAAQASVRRAARGLGLQQALQVGIEGKGQGVQEEAGSLCAGLQQAHTALQREGRAAVWAMLWTMAQQQCYSMCCMAPATQAHLQQRRRTLGGAQVRRPPQRVLGRQLALQARLQRLLGGGG